MVSDSKPAMMAVEDALETVLQAAPLLSAEEVVLERVSGRVLAEEVRADSDQPPFDRAMMDGFALRTQDLISTPCDLTLVEEIPAGVVPTRALQAGEAARIMTGAPVPRGADAVQMVEKTTTQDKHNDSNNQQI